MKVTATELPEVLLIEPKLYPDDRGYLLEQFNVARYQELGMGPIAQINHSRSRRHTIRGLHFQEPQPQGKLVWVPYGALLDIAVDVRVGSPRFGKHMAIELSEDNHRQLWIPAGFAHGFCVLSEWVDCYYACTGFYAPEYGRGIRWNDPALGIQWPTDAPLLSDKDAKAPTLSQSGVLPRFEG